MAYYRTKHLISSSGGGMASGGMASGGGGMASLNLPPMGVGIIIRYILRRQPLEATALRNCHLAGFVAVGDGFVS